MYISANQDAGAMISPSTPHMSLDAAGLVSLADLSTLAQRTAYTGTSTLLDCFVLCPGIHRQQAATSLNNGEYPAVAAMTSGYVFRVENPGTVFFLQKVGRTGQLTTIRVTRTPDHTPFRSLISGLICVDNASWFTYVMYAATVSATLATLVLMALTEDNWGIVIVTLLVFCRATNTIIIRRRSTPGWFGAPEPGVDGDLLVLLSQDRWVRIRGAVDDLKAVTSGQWLRDPTTIESYFSAFATMLLYVTAALTSNVAALGKILLMSLLAGSVALVALVNTATHVLQMHGRTLKVEGERRVYKRRLEMAEELIKEVGREDWAIRLGMINRPAKESDNPPIM